MNMQASIIERVFIGLCFFWFVYLWIAFGTSIPYLDSGIDFLQAHDFYTGGIPLLGFHWASLHPPLKTAVVSVLFFLFGVSGRTYALFGLLLGSISCYSYYTIVKKNTTSLLFIAGMMMVFLLYPLGTAGMIGGFTDYALFTWCLLAWAGYCTNKRVVVIIASLCAVLTKEPGVLLPGSLIIAEFFHTYAAKSKIQWKYILVIFSTTLGLFVWLYILSLYGKGAWSDHILSEGYSSNGIIVALQNISSGGWNNPYALQNALHVFIMNFHWVYWIVAIVGLCIWVSVLFLHGKQQKIQRNALLPAGIFALFYVVLVLSFPTYAIPRYILPVSASLFIFLVYGMNGYWFIHKTWYVLCWAVLVFVSITGLYRSVDPLSLSIWNTLKLDNQTVYNMRDSQAGNDGITYNLQESFLQKQRTITIHNGMLKPTDCYQWRLYDPNNDKRIFSILAIPIVYSTIDCLH
ncbi:MAG: hypothetical protein V1917_02170 [Candidatus Gottesmanbacteria bacterium]